jgi:hypothetical protein
MDVMILKMTNGDEVVTEYVNEEENCVVVNRPRTLQMMQGPQGIQMGLMPWIISAPESKCTISKESIACSMIAPDDISKAYLQQTSGIQLTSLMG